MRRATPLVGLLGLAALLACGRAGPPVRSRPAPPPAPAAAVQAPTAVAPPAQEPERDSEEKKP